MIPPTTMHQWKMFCMIAAAGNTAQFMQLWDDTPYSEVVEMYALEITRNYRPPDYYKSK